jgi:hypothetical protein
VTERSKSIVRQWNREIEDETRREAARAAGARRPWRAVTWGAIWALWLVLLVGLLGHIKSLG